MAVQTPSGPTYKALLPKVAKLELQIDMESERRYSTSVT